MTQQLEFEGSNVEKAAIAASEALNIPREKLQYQVISYGSTGIFGLVGTKKAKIRVILPKEKAKSDSDTADRVNEKKAALVSGSNEPDENYTSAQEENIVSPIENNDPETVGLNTLNQIANLISERTKGCAVPTACSESRLIGRS